MKIYHAPEKITGIIGKKIFLAGTIDMGQSENWQKRTIDFFANKPCTIFNPRRDDWDGAWKQEISNPQFQEQVNWELDALENANIIIMNFLAGSQSPVTMLELGLFASSGKLMVCCPTGFWRKGNVEIVCNRYDVPFYENIANLLSDIQI